MTEISDHDAYIAAAPEPLRPLLARLRVQLARILPDADDIAASGLKATKTGVPFSPSKPIPDELVENLARASRKDQGL